MSLHVIHRDLIRSFTRPSADAVITSAERSIGLPQDLLGSAAKRLTAAALVYAAVYVVQYAVRSAVPHVEASGAQFEPAPQGVLTAVFVLLSLAVAAMAGSRRVPLDLVPDVGLVYLVIGAVGIEIDLLWLPPETPLVMIGLSWVVVWLAAYPLIVPATPGKTLVAALLAAGVRPLMLLVLAARGRPAPDVGSLVQVLFPNVVGVGLALLGSRIIIGLSRDLSRARRMGSYSLVERLGAGGMGEVWRAEHRLLARPAAIKLIRPEALGQAEPEARRQLLRRFEREVQATAVLSSPHTIQVHDFGITDDSTFYYVMELLRGLNAEQLVERFGPIPAGRAAFILGQVCESLGEAHQKGLIHRDIKPANVYLCRRGLVCDFVKVLDFGLVKAASVPGATDAALTAQNVATGTPAYMAPEVALGDPIVDGRTDIYSIGCLGYWLTTGRLVFENGGPMQIMMAHASQQPQPPSRRSEQRIPPDFDDLIMSCLAKEPGGRPRSADALRRTLDAMRFEEPWDRDAAAAWWAKHLPDLA